jgi:hypothetical protein
MLWTITCLFLNSSKQRRLNLSLLAQYAVSSWNYLGAKIYALCKRLYKPSPQTMTLSFNGRFTDLLLPLPWDRTQPGKAQWNALLYKSTCTHTHTHIHDLSAFWTNDLKPLPTSSFKLQIASLQGIHFTRRRGRRNPRREHGPMTV